MKRNKTKETIPLSISDKSMRKDLANVWNALKLVTQQVYGGDIDNEDDNGDDVDYDGNDDDGNDDDVDDDGDNDNDDNFDDGVDDEDDD